jgi:prepilin-type processing-associated H-X9-DG protein
MKRRSNFTLIELSLVIMCTAALLLPALQRARESAHRANCRGNLNQIGKALRMYANDYDGKFPNGPAKIGENEELPAREFYGRDRCGGFEMLRINNYLCDYAVYVCPSSSVAPGNGNDSLSWSNSGSGSGKANLSYAHKAGMVDGDSTETGMSGSGICADLTGDVADNNGGAANHTQFGNILYLDGHVRGFAGPGWFSPANAGYPELAVGDTVMTPNTLRDPGTGEAR